MFGYDAQILVVQEAADRFHRLVAGGHSLNHRSRTGHHVTAGENIGNGSLHGRGIDGQGRSARPLQLG